MKLNKLIAFLFEDDPRFGKYLLGQVRKKPKNNPERDTETEFRFAKDLYYHYHGEMNDLKPWIPVIDRLEKKGYTKTY